MDMTELKSKGSQELGKELSDLLRAQFSLRMQIATQQLNNTSQLRKVRRDIARVQTVMTQTAAAKSTKRLFLRKPEKRAGAR